MDESKVQHTERREKINFGKKENKIKEKKLEKKERKKCM